MASPAAPAARPVASSSRDSRRLPLARYTGPDTVTYSRIYETNTGDGIFTSTPRSALDVGGEITADRFTLRDAATTDLWSWDLDVDPTDQKSRVRLLYFLPGYPNGYGVVTVKGDHLGINNENPRVQWGVNGFAAVTGRLSFTQDTGTTTPTFGMDNVLVNNQSTFRFYYQPGFNNWGSILMTATSNRVGFFNAAPPRTGVDAWTDVTATSRINLAQDTGTSTPTWHLENNNSLFRVYHQSNINSSSGTTVLTATLSGRVGIGVNEPAHTLDVAGSVAINGAGNALVFPDGTSMTTAPLPGPVFGVCLSNLPVQLSCSCEHLLSQTLISAGGSCTVSAVVGPCSATSGPTTFGACCVCA